MAMIEFQDGSIQVDAAVIADGLGIDPASVHDLLRQGKITSRYERGVDEDEGRHRLTFITEQRQFRVVIDDAGNVVQRSTVTFAENPAAAPKPG